MINTLVSKSYSSPVYVDTKDLKVSKIVYLSATKQLLLASKDN